MAGPISETLQAFQEAGADVLYARGLATKKDIATARFPGSSVNAVTGLDH